MSVLDKVRAAVKKKNSSEGNDDKAEFKLSGSEEEKIREFETRAREMDSIIGRMEAAGVDTKEVTAEIRNIVRDII